MARLSWYLFYLIVLTALLVLVTYAERVDVVSHKIKWYFTIFTINCAFHKLNLFFWWIICKCHSWNSSNNINKWFVRASYRFPHNNVPQEGKGLHLSLKTKPPVILCYWFFIFYFATMHLCVFIRIKFLLSSAQVNQPQLKEWCWTEEG